MGVRSLLKRLVSFLRKECKPYIEQQIKDANMFIVIARSLGCELPTDELGQLALRWVAKHGPPTAESVKRYLEL